MPSASRPRRDDCSDHDNRGGELHRRRGRQAFEGGNFRFLHAQMVRRGGPAGSERARIEKSSLPQDGGSGATVHQIAAITGHKDLRRGRSLHAGRRSGAPCAPVGRPDDRPPLGRNANRNCQTGGSGLANHGERPMTTKPKNRIAAPGRSPDAARVRAVRARPRAPHQHEARNCRAPAAGFEDLFSGPASGLLRHQDAS